MESVLHVKLLFVTFVNSLKSLKLLDVDIKFVKNVRRTLLRSKDLLGIRGVWEMLRILIINAFFVKGLT
jgi:hypothetical protein